MDFKKEGNKQEERRIKQVNKTEKEVNFEEWREVIKDNFPELLTPTTIGLSMISQLLINDITNAGAVILLGLPSSGKTLTINIFSHLDGFTYDADNFTPKAFVSGAANVSAEKLEKVDLLPKIRHKLFLVRDLAPLFSNSDEQLQLVLGTLTRILDGEGYRFHSGVHGDRGYRGDYLFFMLGASTPIQNRVWKFMGNLGHRILFYRMKTLTKSKDDYIAQLTGQQYKAKIEVCRSITKQILETIWFKHQTGIEWDRKSDPHEIMEKIVSLALLTAKLRTGIIPSKDKDDEDITVNTEGADRLSQWFYNLARGHAVIHGRTQLQGEDLNIILELAIDSGTTLRSQLFRSLVISDGSMTTADIIIALQKSQTTALKLMNEFALLGIGNIQPTLTDSTGRPENALVLDDEWKWLLEEKYKAQLKRT